MDLQLKDKTVLIVGGGSGIGAACAARFADEGSHVCIWGLKIEKPSAYSLAIQCDIVDVEQIQSATEKTVSTLGSIDCLVHTASIGSGSFGFPFTDVPLASWQRIFDINVIGMANIAYAIAPPMIQQKSGSMIFLSSVAGQNGSQTDPPYSASKAANLNFAMCLARDLAQHNVRVNSVCPGMVQTALNRSVWKAWHDKAPEAQRQDYEVWAAEKIQRLVPLQRWQSPDDIADAILFLSSARASQITGQTINVDGGYVMR